MQAALSSTPTVLGTIAGFATLSDRFFFFFCHSLFLTKDCSRLNIIFVLIDPDLSYEQCLTSFYHNHSDFL